MKKYSGWVNTLEDQHKKTLELHINTLENGANLETLSESTLTHLQFSNKLSKLITESQKFILPLNASLYDFGDSDLEDALTDFVGDKLNLPFPKITLEFHMQLGDSVLVPIVLFVEEDQNSINLYPAFAMKDGTWRISPFLGYSIDRNTYIPSSQNSTALNKMIGNTSAAQNFYLDLGHTAFIAIVQLLCALSCTNVYISDHNIKPSALKQQIRRNKSKTPFYTYKVLTVKPRDNTTPSYALDANEDENIHSSKRFHLRRGHPRKLQSGIKIWVSPCTVGNKQIGIVEKSYKLTA